MDLQKERMSKMTEILLCGCAGKMGQAVQAAVAQRTDCQIVAGVDIVSKRMDFPVFSSIDLVTEPFQVLIDFSNPSCLDSILKFLYDHPSVAAVLCTTGYSQEQVTAIQQASKRSAIFYSRNMSLGVNLLIRLAQRAAEVLGQDFDVEILEMHHNQKIDAPSGTALMIADAIRQVKGNVQYMYDRHSQRKKRGSDEIGIHSVRGGTIVGEHQVIFAGRHETLTLSHSAQSKELFAVGAVNAARFIHGKTAGLYDMSDMI